MTKKIGVLLAGCGVYDGSEIHESVLTLLAIDRAGATAVCIAPDKEQMHTIDHGSGEEAKEARNCLTEAARIARGEVQPLNKVKVEDSDALILPGGFGAAKNLCSFATEGADCSIDPEVDRFIGEILAAKKPLGAICIAPAVVARHFKDKEQSALLTIGTCKETSAALESLGAKHEEKLVDEILVDQENKIVSTPAYMLAESIGEAAVGIEKLVQEVVKMA